MQRNLGEMANNPYDLVIVGGGIYGAVIAWDAVLRGLRVALVEKSDFSSGTSANSLKIIHGGLRYLQNADLKRMRESVREQTTLLSIAPHLVRPLPVLIPTYGHGMRGKEILSLGVMLNHLISADCKLRTHPGRRLPLGRTVSLEEVVRLAPGIERQGLTGGVIFYDAQVRNSERLLLSFLRSSARLGADLANYAEVVGFLTESGGVAGVQVADVLTGDRFEIRGRMVVLACGPWLGSVVGLLRHKQVRPFIRFAKAINIVTRSIFESCAVGLCGQSAPSERRSVIRRRRLLFITPWHDHSLIGTAYASCDAGADDVRATRADIERFVAEINAACPAHKLQPDDVRFVHVGLVPMSNDRRSSGLQLAKHYQIRDHREEGMAGLMSVMGVKYTTARDVAEKVVDHVFRSRDRRPPKSVSAITPVHGGDIHDPAHFLAAESAKKIPGLGRDALRHLIDNYGSAYPEVLNHFGAHRSHGGPGDDFALLRAEVLHGIRVEMAQTLRDVVFRRTDLGTAGHPGKEALGVCAHIMAEELGWTPARMQQERASVTSVFTAWQ